MSAANPTFEEWYAKNGSRYDSQAAARLHYERMLIYRTSKEKGFDPTIQLEHYNRYRENNPIPVSSEEATNAQLEKANDWADMIFGNPITLPALFGISIASFIYYFGTHPELLKSLLSMIGNIPPDSISGEVEVGL